EVVDGNLTVEANQQLTPTSGDFVGVDVDAAMLRSTGTGLVVVKGHGGDAAGGSQHGIRVRNGGIINLGTIVTTSVAGTGRAGGGISNQGVLATGAGSSSTSSGGDVDVTGTGGDSGTSNSNYGVFVASAGTITAGGSGMVNVHGSGGATGGFSNHGVYVVDLG